MCERILREAEQVDIIGVVFDFNNELAVGASVRGATELAELIVAASVARQQAECDLLVLAALWASAQDENCGLAGADRCRCLGAPGTPQVTEYAHDELGTMLHVSGQNAADQMADAVDVRRRLPETWDRIRLGRIRPYQARHLAQATGHLDPADAMMVDDALAPHWGVLPWRRLRTVIEAAIIDADPDAADQRTQAAEAERFVRAGQAGEHGLKLLIAKAAAGDVIFFLATINRLADILATDGDLDPIDVRRSKAIGILANPALALRLLVTHATPDPDRVAPRSATSAEDAPAQPDTEANDTYPSDTEASDVQASDITGLDDPDGGEPDPSTTDPEGDRHQSLLTPGAGDPRAPGWLSEIDHRRLRPTVTLHIHLTDRSLAGGEACPQTARVEDVGPVTLAQVQRFVANPHLRIRIQPVIDPALTAPADSYEIPWRLREAARFRHVVDTFPFAACDARTMDLDHTIPYDRGGPTAVNNLTPLTRPTTAPKPTAAGANDNPTPTPSSGQTAHGWIYLVTPQGTLDLGHTAYADAVWEAARAPTTTRPGWANVRQPKHGPTRELTVRDPNGDGGSRRASHSERPAA